MYGIIYGHFQATTPKPYLYKPSIQLLHRPVGGQKPYRAWRAFVSCVCVARVQYGTPSLICEIKVSIDNGHHFCYDAMSIQGGPNYKMLGKQMTPVDLAAQRCAESLTL